MSERFVVTPTQSPYCSGFTFVELLMVIAILSILAAIALPVYRDYVLRAQATEALIFLGDAKVSVNEFYDRWARMPANNAEAGLRAADTIRGQHLRALTLNDGVIVASLELGDESRGQSFRRTLTFRPWINASHPGTAIIWSCGEHEPDNADGFHPLGTLAPDPIEAKWLPTICRHEAPRS